MQSGIAEAQAKASVLGRAAERKRKQRTHEESAHTAASARARVCCVAARALRWRATCLMHVVLCVCVCVSVCVVCVCLCVCVCVCLVCGAVCVSPAGLALRPGELPDKVPDVRALDFGERAGAAVGPAAAPHRKAGFQEERQGFREEERQGFMHEKAALRFQCGPTCTDQLRPPARPSPRRPTAIASREKSRAQHGGSAAREQREGGRAVVRSRYG